MPIPIGAAMLGSAGLNFLGGLFGGAKQGKISQAQLREQQREFNLPLSYTLSRYQQAGPMRDRTAAMLQARLGAAPGAMQLDPHGFMSLGGQRGGPQLGMQQQAAQNYTPGAGGMLTNPTVDRIMQQLGYGPRGAPSEEELERRKVQGIRRGGAFGGVPTEWGGGAFGGASQSRPPGVGGVRPGGAFGGMPPWWRPSRSPYYGPMNAGGAGGAPGGSGY